MRSCELLEKARTLAIERGLDVSQVSCPETLPCDGSFCFWLSDPETDGPSELGKFYLKLEKHFTKNNEQRISK